MNLNVRVCQEGIMELYSRLRMEAARVVAVGEMGINTLVKSIAQLDRQVAFLIVCEGLDVFFRFETLAAGPAR